MSYLVFQIYFILASKRYDHDYKVWKIANAILEIRLQLARRTAAGPQQPADKLTKFTPPD